MRKYGRGTRRQRETHPEEFLTPLGEEFTRVESRTQRLIKRSRSGYSRYAVLARGRGIKRVKRWVVVKVKPTWQLGESTEVRWRDGLYCFAVVLGPNDAPP